MGSLTDLNADVVVLGSNPSAFAVIRRLLQEKTTLSIIIINFDNLDNRTNKPILVPVSLQGLKNLSIPYKELNFKNKKYFSAYIERYANLQRYYFQPMDDLAQTGSNSAKKAKIGGISYQRIPIGLIRFDRFFQFLERLARHEKITTVPHFMDKPGHDLSRVPSPRD